MAKRKNTEHWIVLKGRPIFTCRTRKQAREYIKKNSVHYPEYNYVGKCVKGFRQIILDT